MHKRFQLFLILTGFLVVRSFAQNTFETNSSGQKIQKFATVNEWETYFAKKTTTGEKIQPEEYASAAKTSFAGKNYILSAIWFEEAKTGNYSDAEMYSDLAAISRELKDISGEISSMNYYLENFKNGPDAGIFRERFFEIALSGKVYEQIVRSWLALNDSSRNKEPLMNAFFLVQKEKNMKEACDSLAKNLLVVNPRHIAALEWLGEKYYWLGENRYLKSSKNYEQNKTSLNYLKLTQEFEIVSADFNKALTYFDVLWEINHSPRYASFLANIHDRFKNKQKTDYYKNFLK